MSNYAKAGLNMSLADELKALRDSVNLPNSTGVGPSGIAYLDDWFKDIAECCRRHERSHEQALAKLVGLSERGIEDTGREANAALRTQTVAEINDVLRTLE